MRPSILLQAVLLFGASLSLHVIYWRWRHPKRQALALLALFFFPALAYAGLAAASPLDMGAVLLLHAALSACYIQVYPAAQAISPTLKICLLIREAGSAGMTKEDIERRFDIAALLKDRLEDLLAAGLVERAAGGKVALTRQGAGLIAPFILFRSALGLGVGKG